MRRTGSWRRVDLAFMRVGLGMAAALAALLLPVPGALGAIPQQGGAIDALDPHNLRLVGPAGAGLAFGSSAAFAGDVNGDGQDDLLVGARRSGGDDGGAYVVYGGIEPQQIELDASGGIDSSQGFRMVAPPGSELLAGRAVAAAGDFNDDGYDDVMVGANGIEGNVGGAFVVFGAPSRSTVTLDPAGLDPEVGSLLRGPAPVDNAGISLAGGEDVNDDGIDDVVVGDGGYDPGGAANNGAAFVVYGQAGDGGTVPLGSLPAGRGFRILGAEEGDRQGTVGMAGDVNGDGVGDVIVGAIGSFVSTTTVGYGAVVYGASGHGDVALDRGGIDPATGFMINGAAANDDTGAAVAGTGDVNDDGYDDVVVGAPNATVGSAGVGAAFVVYGGEAGSTVTVDANGLPAATGFAVRGPSAIASTPHAGAGVGGGADLNGDGIDDTALAAYGAGYLTGSGNVPNVGEVAVVYGADGGRGTLTLPAANGALDPADGFLVHGPGASTYFGNPVDAPAGMHAVSVGGDFNGDGRPDLAVGAARYASSDGLAVATLGFAPPSIAYPGAATGVVGTPVSLSPEAVVRTGPAAFSVSPELPAGLSLDPATGEIGGTPTGPAGAAAYTVTMEDLVGEASDEIQLSVAAASVKPGETGPTDRGSSPSPGPTQRSSAPPAPALALSGLAVSPRRLLLDRRGRIARRAKLRFSLSSGASVIAVLRRLGKLRVCQGQGHCRRLARRVRVDLGARPAGRSTIRLAKLMRGRLAPGRYRLTVTAVASPQRDTARIGIRLRRPRPHARPGKGHRRAPRGGAPVSGG